MTHHQCSIFHDSSVTNAFQLDDGPCCVSVAFDETFFGLQRIICCLNEVACLGHGGGEPMNHRPLVSTAHRGNDRFTVMQVHVCKFLQSNIQEFQIFVFQQNRAIGQIPSALAHGWVVGMNRDLQ